MPSSGPVFSTPLTRLFDIHSSLTNAGGIGVIGGLRQTPKILQKNIDALKSYLEDKNAPFGVDLLLPQYDYTNGQLDELLDVIIRSRAALFVSACRRASKAAVDKLHAAGIPHVNKALAQGVDIICAQGGEGGGHTGDIPFSILVPAVPIIVVAAGGIADGRGLAAALSRTADTGAAASEEAGAPFKHKELAGYDDIVRTLVYSGRPMSVHKTPYSHRQQEILDLLKLEKHPEKSVEGRMWLMGRVAGSINDIKPAKVIVDEIINSAAASLRNASSSIVREAKL
ncbi:2-nitropropane dioxygenase [Pisolithus microcarpus]|nr:2-nitropropane dioxygenase [Pisolithus microcarpus]